MTSRPSGPHRGHEAAPDSGAPLLTVVKGEPSAEELAALTVVVAALSQRRSRKRPTPIGGWAAYGRSHRRPEALGPGGWRAAGSPA
ncbi:acyl-CoA carboxylase subunit epsilon [Blastococcus sp. TML/M2B]|uniref:acyl-CoA carboxylase subunit epsilon n=1 Tax=unclassified Blastococcus TaxID=2619396 RepID=UPI00190949C1|nr:MULTISPECIES: acyl-CoA carboxylase subunit epsilon [unclassified Blastococcus]MBN1093846.1 acyl-CoA carboxylase subunit epsilon [Blastococcus sp. TML/M2B]MBN1096032.1 acyl-CoA carboxylase subunit epsilon [Blastococcus sp. TML/C7B]